MYFDINVGVCQCPSIPYSDSVASSSYPFFTWCPILPSHYSFFCFPLVTITFLSPLGDRGQLSERQTYATVHIPCFFWMWLNIFLASTHIFCVGSPTQKVTTFTAMKTLKWTFCLLEPSLCPVVFSWLWFFSPACFSVGSTGTWQRDSFLFVPHCKLLCAVEMNI